MNKNDPVQEARWALLNILIQHQEALETWKCLFVWPPVLPSGWVLRLWPASGSPPREAPPNTSVTLHLSVTWNMSWVICYQCFHVKPYVPRSVNSLVSEDVSQRMEWSCSLTTIARKMTGEEVLGCPCQSSFHCNWERLIGCLKCNMWFTLCNFPSETSGSAKQHSIK